MIRTLLTKGDGIGDRIWLRSVVKTMQNGLVNRGESLTVDGKFGPGTKRAIKLFQAENGISETGIFDKPSWSHIESFLPDRNTDDAQALSAFFGDLEWVHQQEGHAGKPYWPGGNSGVTLDPGLDLGHVSKELVSKFYDPILSASQMKEVESVLGIKGVDARDAMNMSAKLQTIRISSKQSANLMFHTAKPYWDGISRRFPALKRKSTLPSVQTSVLSLAYNRGVFNRHLAIIDAPLITKDWHAVAEIIGNMQQSHKLSGIRLRRRQEKFIIHAELEYLGR